MPAIKTLTASCIRWINPHSCKEERRKTAKEKEGKQQLAILWSPLDAKPLLVRCQFFFLYTLEGSALIISLVSSPALSGRQVLNLSVCLRKSGWTSVCVSNWEAALGRMSTMYAVVHHLIKRHWALPFFLRHGSKMLNAAKSSCYAFRELLLVSHLSVASGWATLLIKALSRAQDLVPHSLFAEPEVLLCSLTFALPHRCCPASPESSVPLCVGARSQHFMCQYL